MNFILTSIARFSTHPKYPLSKPERIIAHVFATFTIFACEVHREKAKNERKKKRQGKITIAFSRWKWYLAVSFHFNIECLLWYVLLPICSSIFSYHLVGYMQSNHIVNDVHVDRAQLASEFSNLNIEQTRNVRFTSKLQWTFSIGTWESIYSVLA